MAGELRPKRDRKYPRHSPAPFANLIGRTRYVVLIAVAAVLLVAISLFLLGAVQAFLGIYDAWKRTFTNEINAAHLTVEFLELVGVMLKAVVFYLIGVGLYSLFIAPLNIAVSLGVESLYDLESKVMSVVVVILAVIFLEHFVRWEDPLVTLQFAGSLSITVLAIVAFQWVSHRSREDQREHDPNTQVRSKAEMFEMDEEVHEIRKDEV